MPKEKGFDCPVTCQNCGCQTEGRMVHRFFDDPADVFDRGIVTALSAALARGDCASATVELELLFRDEPLIREWIDQGKARRAA